MQQNKLGTTVDRSNTLVGKVEASQRKFAGAVHALEKGVETKLTDAEANWRTWTAVDVG